MCEFNRIAFISESKSTVCSKYSIALCRFNYQIFNSHTAVFDCFLRRAGNITEAPPVANEARRCWRKTRSIAPAPRAIGDYVLRGLNGLRSKTHERALVQAPARLRANVPSCLLRRATYVLRRGVAGVSGRSRPQGGEQVSVLHSKTACT